MVDNGPPATRQKSKPPRDPLAFKFLPSVLVTTRSGNITKNQSYDFVTCSNPVTNSLPPINSRPPPPPPPPKKKPSSIPTPSRVISPSHHQTRKSTGKKAVVKGGLFVHSFFAFLPLVLHLESVPRG